MQASPDCRRSAFAKEHNIIDGFEGDKGEDLKSINHGKRMRNGWKNSAPWTYKLDPKLVWLPSAEELKIPVISLNAF